MINLYINVLVVLLSGMAAYWLLGHSIAVFINRGPKGDGSEKYKRDRHPVKHFLYVTLLFSLGLWAFGYAVFFTLFLLK